MSSRQPKRSLSSVNGSRVVASAWQVSQSAVTYNRHCSTIAPMTSGADRIATARKLMTGRSANRIVATASPALMGAQMAGRAARATRLASLTRQKSNRHYAQPGVGGCCPWILGTVLFLPLWATTTLPPTVAPTVASGKPDYDAMAEQSAQRCIHLEKSTRYTLLFGAAHQVLSAMNALQDS